MQKGHAANVVQFPRNPSADVRCVECDDMGWVLDRHPDRDPIARPCHCRESLTQYRTRVLLEQSGLSRHEYETKRFDRFNTALHPDCPAMLDAAWQWLTKTPPWLVFIGDNGIGKSHLAMASVAELVDTGNIARYIAWYDLTGMLRSAMRASDNADAGYDLQIKELSEIPWLVIDDISDEECRTPFQIAALTALMDRRDRNGYPTMVVMNLTLDEMAVKSKRVADRLRNQSLCNVFIAENAVSVRPMLRPGGLA